MSKYRNMEIERFAGFFKALSNPHRLRIFLRLVSCCVSRATCRWDDDSGACVGELGKDLNLAPSTISHHIKELCQAGLIQMRRSGQNVECSVTKEILDDLSDFISNCCGGVLEKSLKLPNRN